MKQEFTFEEKFCLVERLMKYSPVVNPLTVNYFWTDFWLIGTCGMFKPSNNIYLSAKDKLAILDGVADDVICHELVHYKQYQEQGWVKYAIRNLTKLNEAEAYAEQERVRKIIEGA